jgi:Ala-tRNA(Pro) deacylase
MVAKKLRDFLDGAGIRYITITHSKAFTAPEVAASAHVPGAELAKTVILRVDGHLAMAVVSANHHVDLEALRAATQARNVGIAGEAEFRDAFPGCEVGGMPPFGHLWGLDVYADAHLAEREAITFNAGSHTELIRVSWSDFERLAEPRILEFARS